MEYLAPPLNALLHVQLKIKCGSSVKSALQSYIKNYPTCPFAKQINLWLFYMETGQTVPQDWMKKHKYRKNLLDIFSRGIAGEPILKFLKDFQEELSMICHHELEQHIQKLPFITLIPLFLLEVPAVFLLLLGPLILELQNSLAN